MDIRLRKNTDLPAAPTVPTLDPPPRVLPGVVTGFGTAVAMWTLWWITHLPAWGLAGPPWGISLPLLAMTLFLGSLTGASGSIRPLLTGAIAGLITALLSLIVLGAVLSETGGDSASAEAARMLRADAPAIFGGFMLASTAVGTLGGLAAKAGRGLLGPAAPGRPGSRRWLGRLGVVAAVSFVPLIAIGGAVTSTASGMAVEEPVVSFVMPLSLMAEPRVFIEHTHRLVGSLVGLTAITLFLATLLIDRRTIARLLTGVLLALVVTQGLLGIFRVGENSAALALLHGMFAQLVFATGVAAAVVLSPAFAARRDPPRPVAVRSATDPDDAHRRGRTALRFGRWAATAGLGLYALQLATGAASRHLGSAHATWTHVVFAVVVASTVGLAGASLASLRRDSPDLRRLASIGTALVGVVGLQFMLGFATILVVGGSRRRVIPTEDQLAAAEAIRGGQALIATVHQTTGALLLALLVLAALWSAKAAIDRRPPTAVPAGRTGEDSHAARTPATAL